MLHNIPEVCVLVLHQIYGENLEQYDVTNDGSGKKGEGYVNEMVFLKVTKTDGDDHLVVKAMPDADDKNKQLVIVLYETEINFYENAWPALDRFQKNVLAGQYFEKIPRCFCSASHNDRKVVVLENLKKSGFALRGKELFYDRYLIDFAFKNFAAFHALSLALKDKNPGEFDRLKNSFVNNSWHNFRDSTLIRFLVPGLAQLAVSGLDETEEDIKNHMKEFASRVLEEFADVTVYKGSHDVITHGDCWINNFMFKSNESGQPEDLRFIDFQFVQVATPVYDLSYFFYTGAIKDQLDDLEHYLSVYHDTLSSRLREFGCDPDKLYPYQVLKEEWKQYSKFGFIMGLLLWAEKFSTEAVDIMKEDELQHSSDDKSFDKTLYQRCTKDMIHHFYQNGFL